MIKLCSLFHLEYSINYHTSSSKIHWHYLPIGLLTKNYNILWLYDGR